MANEKNNNQDQSNQQSITRYKFMTNILSESKHRTQYIKSLEKFVMDARIPISRIVVALFASVILLIFTLHNLFSDSLKLRYVAVPVILAAISGYSLIFMYLMPSRNKSMLDSAIELLLASFNESVRRKGEEKTDLKSFGIDKVKNGVCVMSNGDYGLVYEVEGHLSRSALPAIADAAAIAREKYLVARNATSYTTLVISIKRTDLTSQIEHLEDLTMKRTDKVSANDDWRNYMAAINYKYLSEKIENTDMSIYQILILCDSTVDNLIKSKDTFESAAINGMYAKCKHIASKKLIVSKLSEMTSLSKKGVEENAQGEEKIFERQ